MTISILWYREKFDEIWCAADSRISSNNSITTDSGPKIMSIPVVCYQGKGGGDFRKDKSYSFGFAFAGSALSANCTHSLATSCTQNLATFNNNPEPISLEQVARLYRQVAENYIKDISTRSTGSLSNQEAFHFNAFIFGHCPREKKYKAFCIAPKIFERKFQMEIAEAEMKPDTYYPLGSGTKDFVKLSKKLHKTRKNSGVILTLREMFKREKRPDIGGYFQIGVAHKKGFELRPIIRRFPNRKGAVLNFLGFNIESIKHFEDYRIGFKAFYPDVD